MGQKKRTKWLTEEEISLIDFLRKNYDARLVLTLAIQSRVNAEKDMLHIAKEQEHELVKAKCQSSICDLNYILALLGGVGDEQKASVGL